MKQRCAWVNDNPLMIAYHDLEWGVPLRDDQKLFEFFVLDAFQAGLSWQTIINKRKNFEKAFDNFNVKKIANYTEKDVNRLLQDAGIIRNRMKIEATVTNAKRFLEMQKEYGSFDTFIWQFTNQKTITNKWTSLKELPPRTEISDQMSVVLKKEGLKFVGSTICYAFMQATGMVNDHLVSCFRHSEIKPRR